ncbi:hypothetical protein DFH09DRAFT_1361732 [Mycena vulgaris]|nr:hypothetical protein DFH09DRAFT_1361732 [Mycena vulgaris]
MTESVFGIQELCDQISNHMALHATSHDDLKSTALVCHTLCISAQRQIFRHINLDPLPRRASAYSAGSRSTGESVLGAATSALRRLSAVLTASPHLLRSITSVSILASPEILEPLSSIRFPVIEKISFSFLEMQPLDDNIIRWTRDWIALPSIREVVLIGFCQKLVMDHISAIFDTCSPNLDALTITVLFTLDPSPASASHPREPRARIKRLKLNTVIGDWLIVPSSPFDFTGLVDVEITGRENPAVLQVLTSSRRSIRRLRIIGAILNLAEFSALTCLEMELSRRGVISSLKPENAVETLVLHVRASEFGRGGIIQTFWATDLVVAKSPMQGLRQVEVRISGPSNAMFDLGRIGPHFPKLMARGLLKVTDYRFLRSSDPTRGPRLPLSLVEILQGVSPD